MNIETERGTNLVEIDAGDTFLYDEAASADKTTREQAAADRLFGLPPENQGAELRALWEEFEENLSPTARFARGLDRLMPLLHNYFTGGRTWREHGIKSAQVYKMNALIEQASPELWHFARSLIDDAVARGYLEP